MKIASKQVTQAIYTRLTSGSNKIRWRVYDYVPDRAKPPYVGMGESILIGDETNKEDGRTRMVQTLHCWSIQRTWDEVDDMANDIVESLTVSNSLTPNIITTTNFTIAHSNLESFRKIMDIDGLTRHGIIEVGYLLYEK
jgi:hypothetical protein